MSAPLREQPAGRLRRKRCACRIKSARSFVKMREAGRDSISVVVVVAVCVSKAELSSAPNQVIITAHEPSRPTYYSRYPASCVRPPPPSLPVHAVIPHFQNSQAFVRYQSQPYLRFHPTSEGCGDHTAFRDTPSGSAAVGRRFISESNAQGRGVVKCPWRCMAHVSHR